MKRLSKIVLAGSGFCLLAAAGFALRPRSAPVPVDVQIAQTLQEAEEAARSGDVAGVLEAISDDFRSGELTRARLQLLLRRARRETRPVDYDVQVLRPRVLPARLDRPDERVVISRFAVFDPGSGENFWGTGPLTLVMRREERRRALLFREPCWRVVSIANLPPIPFDDGSSGP